MGTRLLMLMRMHGRRETRIATHIGGSFLEQSDHVVDCPAENLLLLVLVLWIAARIAPAISMVNDVGEPTGAAVPASIVGGINPMFQPRRSNERGDGGV